MSYERTLLAHPARTELFFEDLLDLARRGRANGTPATADAVIRQNMVARCLQVEGLTYEIVFGASGNTWQIYDTPRAWRVLGFQPQDNAESYR